MSTLFLVVCTLVLAVVGRALFDPMKADDHGHADDAATAEQQARMMETMALSVF
jgi:hypothetical protein